MATPLNRLRQRMGALISGPAAPSPARTDSSTPPTPSGAGGTSRGGSGMRNPLSGLGLASDMATQGRPNMWRVPLSLDELDVAYQTGIYGRIVDVLPNYATRKWVQLDGEGSQRVGDRLAELKAQARFRDADRWGQCHGESRILIVTDDPMPKAAPLIPRTVRRVKALHVLDAREFSPRSWCADPEDPNWGEVETYNVHPVRPGGTVPRVVHASRLLRFYGHPRAPSARARNEILPWGADAVGQRIWDGVRGLAQTAGAGERLALELSVAVFKIGSLMQKAGGDGRDAFTGAVRLMNWTKSVANAILLGPNDEYQRVSANPTGFKDLSEGAQRYLAAVTGRPLVLLFGQSPGGLNSDGDSWWNHWRNTVAQHQEERYRDPLEHLIDLIYYETLDEVPRYTLTFNPLGELTPAEEAQVRLVNAQRDEIYMRNQVYGAERVAKSRFGDDGYQEIGPPDESAGEPDIAAAVEALMAGRADAIEYHDVPKAVSEAAALGLELREEFGRGMPVPEGGGPATGALTAGKLKRGKVSDHDVLLMAAWRARHGAQVDRRAKGWGDRENPSAQWISWLGWGGDEADGWLKRLEPGARERVRGG